MYSSNAMEYANTLLVTMDFTAAGAVEQASNWLAGANNVIYSIQLLCRMGPYTMRADHQGNQADTRVLEGWQKQESWQS